LPRFTPPPPPLHPTHFLFQCVCVYVRENCFYITWSSVGFLLGFRFPFGPCVIMWHTHCCSACCVLHFRSGSCRHAHTLIAPPSSKGKLLHSPPFSLTFRGQFSPSWHAVSRPSSCLVIVCLILYAGYPSVFLPLSCCHRNASNNNSNIKCGRGHSFP